jgi:hypothetical protein
MDSRGYVTTIHTTLSVDPALMITRLRPGPTFDDELYHPILLTLLF